MAVVLPYNGKHSVKLLYKTVYYYTKYAYVYVVSPTFILLPDGVKLVKQVHPKYAARYDGYKAALEDGYDVIINADSHTWSNMPLDPVLECAKKYGWCSAPHLIHTLEFLGYRYYSYLWVDPVTQRLKWCHSLIYKDTIPMTNEPLIAYRSDVLRSILDYYLYWNEYALDHVALLFAPPGHLLKPEEYHFYHAITSTVPRKPSTEKADEFKKRVWPLVKDKVTHVPSHCGSLE